MEGAELGYDDLASDEAIALIYYDETKREFIVNPDACNFLKTIESPVGVIAVAGMYRTGKSYLLNRVLLKRNNGFGVGSTVNACTKGLWVWKKSIKGKSPDNEDINVLVIDSEGLGALDEDSNHDVRIFSLAILLSSYFIYNSMGSIDENALQSLSLVVNLTKHIQIKASGMSHDIDPEEYSRYFPSFMWVVRDFALQLVDQDGESITPKEYLDKALQEQKGFSESVEQKNRIRKLLKCFFKDRDCSCVVRPLTSEEGLQNLESKDFNSLREEFRTQISQLRTKVMKRVKAKTILNGKKLNGEMFVGLVYNYVDAINKGAVPNIESAWNYISKNECQKAMETAFEHFCEELHENFSMNAPMFENELSDFFKDAKEAALKIFNQSSVGEVSVEYRNELKAKCKNKYSQIKAENEKETRMACNNFLQDYFVPIESKLRNQEYTDFGEYEKVLKSVEQEFLDRGPQGPNRASICQDFIIGALTDGCFYFLRTMQNELTLQKSLNSESMSKLEARIQELKSDLLKSREESDSKIRGLENDKAQLSAKEQSMRESLVELKKEKESSEKEWKSRLQSERTENNRTVEEYKNRMYTSEESAKEAQRRMVSSESENEKQKALLEQKVGFLENTIESLKQKEKDYQNEIKNQKKDLISSMKDNTQKYEDKIQNLNKKVDTYQEEIAEKDNTISELEQKVYVFNTTIGEKDIELQTLKDASAELEELKDQNDKLKREIDDKNKVFNQELQDDRDNLKYQLDELTHSIQEKTHQFDGDKSRWENERTIMQQKVEFLNTQIQEAKNQIEENRKTHEAMLKAVQSRESEKGEVIEEADKKIEKLKQDHLQEMKNMEQRFDAAQKRLSDDLEKSRTTENDIKMKFKLTTAENEKEISDLKIALEEAEAMRDRYQSEAKQLETQKQNLLQATEERYRNKLSELESEIAQKDASSQNELDDYKRKSEDDLSQLKSYYESERERLEKRIQDEKQKGVRNVEATKDDYEQRMRDDQMQHDDEMEMIQEELREKEAQLQSIVHQSEHELSMYEQKVVNLEEHLKETKKALDDIQEKHSKTIDQQMNNFNKERKELLDKTDEITQSLTEKEKRITALENQNESLLYQTKKKDEDIETFRTELSSQKRNADEQIEKIREDSQKISDEAMKDKLEHGREEALLRQQNEYLEKKNQELVKALTDSSMSYQEKLDLQKTEMNNEINQKIEQLTAEKEKVTKKFEDKRSALKEIEKTSSVSITKLEREKAVCEEKIQNLERKLANEQENGKTAIENLKEQISKLQSEGSKSLQDVELKHNELKGQHNSLEKEKTELTSKFEREQALLQNQVAFIQEQNANLKKELAEKHNKLEGAINQLQTKSSHRDQDKKSLEMLNKMEREYKDQINSMQESHERILKDMSNKSKDIEGKYHGLQEKHEISVREGNSVNRGLEKRLDDLQKREKSYIEEISKLKEDRDRMLLDNQSTLDREKDTLKVKINELERKFKDSERETLSLRIENEKEKTRLNSEINNLENNNSELQDKLSRVEKRKETLIAENEKLKERNKNKQRMTSKYSTNSSILESGLGSRFVAGKFLGVKELDHDNYSNSSNKGSRFGTFTKFIGDGKEIGDKKSSTSTDDNKMLSDTPERYDKGSESTNTLSPQDENK